MNASDESDEMRWRLFGERKKRKKRGERLGTSLILHDDRH